MAAGDAAVLRQMRRMFGSAMHVQVGGRAGEVARQFTESLHRERRARLDGDADRGIKTFPD